MGGLIVSKDNRARYMDYPSRYFETLNDIFLLQKPEIGLSTFKGKEKSVSIGFAVVPENEFRIFVLSLFDIFASDFYLLDVTFSSIQFYGILATNFSVWAGYSKIARWSSRGNKSH